MAELTPPPRQRFFDADGKPLAGGKLYTYLAGTSSPRATYTDHSGASYNTNPVILDGNGYADIYMGTGYMKWVLKDSNDTTLWTRDFVGLPSGAAQAVPAGGSTGQVLMKVSASDYDYAWATPTVGRAGKVALAASTSILGVVFSSALANTNYAVALTFENQTDADPIFIMATVTSKSTTGFQVLLSAPVDTGNTILNWTATVNA